MQNSQDLKSFTEDSDQFQLFDSAEVGAVLLFVFGVLLVIDRFGIWK